MLIPKVLIVYDSRTRSSEAVAFAIRNCLEIRGLRCDVEALHQPGGLASLFRRTPVGVETRHRPEDYHLVIVGTPVTSGAPSRQVAAFLEDNALVIQNLAAFFTTGRDDVTAEPAWIEAIAKRPTLAVITVRARDIQAGAHKRLIRPFVERVEAIARTAMAAAAPLPPQPAPVRCAT